MGGGDSVHGPCGGIGENMGRIIEDVLARIEALRARREEARQHEHQQATEIEAWRRYAAVYEIIRDLMARPMPSECPGWALGIKAQFEAVDVDAVDAVCRAYEAQVSRLTAAEAAFEEVQTELQFASRRLDALVRATGE